ncbi:MAG: hypothetical protein WAL83_01975 [Arenicellales bacterium]
MTWFVKYLPPVGLAMALAACGGSSSSGGGTANSPFVGTYHGSTAVTVTAGSGPHTMNEPIAVYVNPDGLVQVGRGESTIYTSGPLHEDSVDITDDAAAMVEPGCSGTITLSGTFSSGRDGGAGFTGTWSSSGASCAGLSGEVSGTVTATRVSTYARATRVFQTGNATLLRVFREAGR